jgi:uncharacterized protein (TIGR02231 family)
VQADAGIQIGEIGVQTVERARAPECASSPLDARIRELEDQQAAIAAESGAQDLVLGYLKNIGTDGRAAAPAPIAVTAETLRKSGQDALQRQHQLLRRTQDLEQQLTPLRAERDRLLKANGQLRTLSIRLTAAQDGELRLSYRLTQAGWTPVYRAYLDSARAQLRLERHAQVAQTSGEDWSGVKLRLSTVQPSQAVNPPAPLPWTLDLLPPPLQEAASVHSLARTFAPAPAMQMAAPPPPRADDEARPPSFDVSVFQGEFAAAFDVPGRVGVASDGQRVAFALGSQSVDAQLFARVQPQQDASAYLVAELARPAGSWPQGSLQLFRDGGFVGQSYLRLGGDERLELFFGRDEMLRVQIEPEQRDAASSGFIGARAERRIAHAYLFENLHKTPLTLQVLEAAPTAQHQDIRVQTQFAPKPTLDAWRKQPGLVAWQLPLAAGQSQRITADYVISYPKDARISGLR